METQYIPVIIFGVITFLILISLMFVNRLFSYKERVDLQFDNVMKYIDERVSLFERMSNFVEETVEEEMNYVNKLNDAIDVLNDMFKERKYNLKEVIKTEKLLHKFTELINTYSYLSKNEIYKMLSNESGVNIDRIEYATVSYNEKAKEFNKIKDTKLNNFISKLFKLSDYEYYEK